MRGLLAVLSIVCWMCSAHSAKADKRVAFVVGNGAYKNVAQLPNPPIDAKAMAAALRKVGFDVVEGTNLTRASMTERLLEFGKKTQGADVAVFFYAGYGIAIDGTNYLLPVDADIKSEMDVKLGATFNVDVTLDQTMGDAKVKLVFLDACRDSPFASQIKTNATRSVSVQQGLAEMKSGEGTLIAFATGPGQTALDGREGANSPFTRALIDNITQPGVEIQQAMTKVRAEVNNQTNKGQLPWGHTNLIGAVYLNPTGTPPAGVSDAATASGQTEIDKIADALRPHGMPATRSAPVGERSDPAGPTTAQLPHEPPPRPELDLPEFPSWPPPMPSASYVLPDRLLERYHTLKEATGAILTALETTGYVERSFFRTEPGGIALVTRLERIEADGSPARPGRWARADDTFPSTQDLINFLRGLFFVKKGHYRLIIFVIQDTPFVLSQKDMAEPEARALIGKGANTMPAATAKRSFEGNHCTALIYEFSSDGKSVVFMPDSPLTGKQHLERAGVLPLLGKSH